MSSRTGTPDDHRFDKINNREETGSDEDDHPYIDIGNTPPRPERSYESPQQSQSYTEQLMSPSPIRNNLNGDNEEPRELDFRRETDDTTTNQWPTPYQVLGFEDLPSIGNTPHEIRSKIRETNQLLVYTMTWNLHGKPADPSFVDFLPPRKTFHLLAFGTEECENTIAKSVVNTSKENWEIQLREALGNEFIPLASQTLQAIHLIVFVHEALFPIISDVQAGVVSCGVGDTLGNKGSVAVGCNVGNTSILFLNCHLAAGQKNVMMRNRDYVRSETLMSMCPSDLPRDKHPIFLSDRYDRVFWMGDLNYRVDLPREDVDLYLRQQDYNTLLKHDQLLMERKEARAFQGFAEGPLGFYPTYKFDKRSDTYDSSPKQRVPSWTDRILFKPASRLMRLLIYDAITSVKCSDHRAVYGTFLVQLRRHFRRADDIAEAEKYPLPGTPSFQSSGSDCRTPVGGNSENFVDVPWSKMDEHHEWGFHASEREHRDKVVRTKNVPVGHTQSQVCALM